LSHFMVNRWFGVGQFLSGAMGQLYPGGDTLLMIWLLNTFLHYTKCIHGNEDFVPWL